jgi:hypothetical protein
MYYLLGDVELLETYKSVFVGNVNTVSYSLDKTKYIVESIKEIEGLEGFKKTQEEAKFIAKSVEWCNNEEN